MGRPHSALLYGASTLFTQEWTSFYWLDMDKVNLAANVQIRTLTMEPYLRDKWGKGGATEPYLWNLIYPVQMGIHPSKDLIKTLTASHNSSNNLG